MNSSVLSRLVVALILAGAACGQTSGSSSDAVAQYVKAEMTRQHIPGVSLLVSRNGAIVQAEGFGFSNVELQVPVKPETLFQSGSVGKQFTATAVMMLVEDGKVRLDDSITKYFPDAPATWKPVTVRHLLSHTGGFTDYPKDFDFRKDYSEADLLKILQDSASLRAGDEMELQQCRISDAGYSDPPRHRHVLRRCVAGENLPAAGHADYAHHE